LLYRFSNITVSALHLHRYGTDIPLKVKKFYRGAAEPPAGNLRAARERSEQGERSDCRAGVTA